MSAISSLASVLGITETATPVTAAISEMDPKTGMEKIQGDVGSKLLGKSSASSLFQGANASPFQAFQYFPETISDSKSPEWARKNVPGGSHPIVTFINGGERVISFPAVFTADKNPEPLGLFQAALTGSFEFGLSDLFDKTRKDTVDIPAAIAFLRKFTCPDYSQFVASPPPFAIVYLPNSGIIGRVNHALDSIVGAMIQCDVTYEKFHRNGMPRIVVVQLAFLEVVQIGENWSFAGRGEINDILTAQGRDPYKREVIGAEQNGGNLSSLFGNLL